MPNTEPRGVTLEPEESATLLQVIKETLAPGVSDKTQPELVIMLGGVGAGKTTKRREEYAEGYVHFDFGEVFLKFEKALGKGHEKLPGISSVACELILADIFGDRLNFVIELIGDDFLIVKSIIDGVTAHGYHVNVISIDADVQESIARHRKAVREDPDYISSYHSQKPTASSLLAFLNKYQGESIE